jgi:hypothetical protein
MPPATVVAHPWHDLPIAPEEDYPTILHAVIEIPRGSKVRLLIHILTSFMEL